MAIYKGREVQLLGRTDGEETTPMFDILDQWQERSSVKFSELQLTEDEKKELDKQGALHLQNAKVISNKDLQELRDSQDRNKIEEKQKKAK